MYLLDKKDYYLNNCPKPLRDSFNTKSHSRQFLICNWPLLSRLKNHNQLVEISQMYFKIVFYIPTMWYIFKKAKKKSQVLIK